MIKSKIAESLIWVVIWVFILSFIILWITNLLINSISVVDEYENKRDINILKNNTINIVKNLDTSIIQETELFYLYKNESTNDFQIKTWSWNYFYKYIDRLWNHIPESELANFSSNIYSRVLWLEREDTSLWESHQIIKASIRKLIKK